MNIYLIGLPGSGKSTVARSLGNKLGKKVIDLDHYIELQSLMFIDEIFEKHGEKTFRKLETEALKNVIDEHAIIACGGGIILDKHNKKWMNGPVFYLDARLETIKNRLKNDYQRPLLLTKTLEDLETERFMKYQNFATVNISNDQDVSQTVQAIIDYLEDEYEEI